MLSVLKVGGSVLRDEASYGTVAVLLGDRLAERPAERLVVIVSAQHGATDELLAEARTIVAGPAIDTAASESRREPPRSGGSSAQRDGESNGAPPAMDTAASESRREPPRSGGSSAQRGGECKGAPPSEVNNEALDLLWSTGELRSVARLALHLQRIGVAAIPFNVHQTGLVADRIAGTTVRPLRLLAALAKSRIVIVPGFLGVSPGGTITSLGRGGSDLTAVLLAIAVGADACELIKDVPGYFTADPHRDATAQQLHDLPIDEALRMADAGCDLVQRAALVAASQADLHLVIRSMDAAAPVTHVHAPTSRKDRSKPYGVRHQDDSRRAAVGA